MAADRKLTWLRRVLLAKAMLSIFVWGLPALLGPPSLLALFGVPVPEDPIYLRLFGGVVTAWGVAYWLASKEPVRNRAILIAGLVDNALATLVIFGLGVTGGVSSTFNWISGVLTGLFFVLFWLLMPGEAGAREG